MIDVTIYSKNGDEKAVVKSLEYDGTFMGDRYVSVSVSSPTVINWAIGDYLEYRGERWSLWLLPATSKVARVTTYGGAIEYKDIRFSPTEEELRRCSFLDIVLHDNEIHYTSLPNFSFYCATAKDLADRIQANLDRLYPGQWTITANPAVSITDQSMTFSNNNCWEALVMANTSLGLNFIVDSANREITIGGEGAFIETVMEYGKGNGLKSIERTIDDNQQVVNRLYAYGNTRNLPYRYYNKRYSEGASIFDKVQSMYLPNLMLPYMCMGWNAEETEGYLDEDGCVRTSYGSEGQKLTYDSATQWYKNPDGTAYEGTVYWFYRHYSLCDDGTTYYCDRVWIESEESVFRCGVQEGVKFFDGSDELVDDIYPSITGFSSTAELAEALGDEEAAAQNLSYEQGELYEILGADVDSWDGVIPEVEETTPTFHIRIKNIGFDLSDAELDASGDTPRLSMKSGMCTGREFNILECKKQVYSNGAWTDYNAESPVSGAWSYYLKCEVAADDSIGQYFPNDNFELAAGDKFVILGIKMPDVYVDVAERRLLKAAIIWLSENDKTAYNYSPAINNIYMSENPETSALLKEGNVLHIYDADLGIDVEMTISQFKIKNDKQIPEYEVTLSNDKEADLVQRVTAQVHQTYTQFIGNGNGGGSGIYLIGTASNSAPTDNNAFSARRSLRMFLRKDIDDAAAGKITFNGGSETKGNADFTDERGYLSGWLGYGARINGEGKAEFEEVNIRGALRAAEIVFNQIRAEGGEKIESIGYGEILDVDEENFKATLKLDGDEWATIDVGDICRGFYNTIGKDDTTEDEGEDANGFRTKAGFFASYFTVTSITKNAKGECEFTYALQPGTTEHPCPLMKFAVYGNFDDDKKERQSSIYTTAVGIAPRQLYLARVNDWKIKPQNIKIAKGNIDGLQVYEKNADGNPVLKTLYGDAGFFVEDNIYFGGILNQFTSADWEYIQSMLGQGIHAQLLRGSDNIIVDALGNVVGGIVVEETEGGVVTNRIYKLHTGILVYDSGKKRYLTAKGMDEEGELGDDEFRISYTCEGCDVMRDGADFYVTRIDNIVSGGVPLTDAQLDLMRDTNECRVNFVITTSNGWKTMMSYPVKITHLDYSYITFDLTNEMDSMAYRTQLKYYDGLPITTQIKAYANGEELGSDAFVSSTMVSENAFTGSYTAAGTLPARVYFTNSGSKVQCSLTKDGVLTISQTSERNVPDMEDTKYYIDISCVVKYAGVQYTSSYKRFVLTETTNATLYKLLLSANAVSKDEGTYTPSTIDVKAQIIDDSGTRVVAPNASGAVAEDIYVKYVNGPYDANSELLSAMPSFADVPVCVTVLLVDTSDGNTVLDVESVPMTAVGRNGAGQPWVKTNFDSFVIDCDHEGNVLEEKTITVTAELYWGDTRCRLNDSSCDIWIGDDQVRIPDDFSGDGYIAYRSFTFQEGSSLESTYINISLADYLNEHTASKTVPVIANKQGTQGVTGRAGAALLFVGEWSEFGQYVWNENIRNAVKHDGLYWLVDVPSDGTEDLGEPSMENDNWLALTTLNITATNILLAENASINLLSSNAINLFSGSILTSSINADGKGSYVIYYPSRNKRMEFSYKGYIYYYNDDDGNTEAWRLGLGGEIETSRSDDWQPFPLYKFNSVASIVFNANTTFDRTVYMRFFAGSVGQYANYDGRVYDRKYLNPIPSDSLRKYIEDGHYTPNQMPYQVLTDEGSRFAITIYHIEDGVITQEYEQFSA